MSRGYDENTLSAFVDGELDSETMNKVDAFLETDSVARNYVYSALKTQVHLRAALRPVVGEDIPQRLLATFEQPPAAVKRIRFKTLPLIRAAAVMVLVLGGVGLGWVLQQIGGSGGFESLPARYSQVVDSALEHNLSGKETNWKPVIGTATVRVTPVRTFRDAEGLYYREYTLVVSDQGQQTRISGLAYRTGQGRWKTKALFF